MTQPLISCLDNNLRAALISFKDIFENPQFEIDGMSANDVRQGAVGDCWFISALCALSNTKDLLSKVCVARNEKVGVYGFVFYRGTFKTRPVPFQLGLSNIDRRWRMEALHR